MFLMLYSPLDTALLWCKCNYRVMATFGCVAQKAASAAQFIYIWTLHLANEVAFSSNASPDWKQLQALLVASLGMC
jgi:hypothetical protein